MLQVLNLVIPLFGLVFLGFIAGKLVKLPLEGLAWLNFFVVYVALPALFFRLLSRTPLEEFANIGFIAATTFATLLIFCVTFFLAGFRNGGNVGESTIQGFAGAYGNIGYMGPPLAIAAFGPEAGVPVALIFCFDNSLHFTLAPLLMAFHSDSRAGALQLLRDILRKIFTHPFILATIVGVAAAIFNWQPPEAIGKLLEVLSSGAAPCALFAMGVTAALRPLKRIPPELAYLLPIKLILHPLLLLVIVSQATHGVPAVWIEVAVLLAALPSATNVFVIAQQYGVWQERASSAVVVSTVLSVFTVTAYIYLAKAGYLAAFLSG
ncbi:MAG: AEC family transporter [Nitratireductor sp.]